MKVYCFAVCCVLFGSIAAFTIPDTIPEYSRNDSLLQTADSEVCQCINGRCVKDNRGRVKCNCKPGHAQQDEFTCQPCVCGEKGKCLFIKHPKSGGGVMYEKKCVCDLGSAEKDGICVYCQCGENSKCEFEGDERFCYCADGFIEKDGVCTRCDCGFNGDCSFVGDKKICECYDGYLEYEGYCKECYCGDNGKCIIINGMKFCHCDYGYSVNEGTCTECHCGTNSVECMFVDGYKMCKCKDGYGDKYGTCTDCDCGTNAMGCTFDGEVKRCECYDGYADKYGTCTETCNTSEDCLNGGKCLEADDNNKFCQCQVGTTGDKCEDVTDCISGKYKGCYGDRGACSYDVKEKIAKCNCPANKALNKYVGYCQDCDCGTNSEGCTFDGGYKKCECDVGYGDNRGKCTDCGCGTNAKGCTFDGQGEVEQCECNEGYADKDKTCTENCKTDKECQNGGTCLDIGNGNMFCRCLRGTTGDKCDIVTDCTTGNYKDCSGEKGECSYDVAKQKAKCECPNNKALRAEIGYCEECNCGEYSQACSFAYDTKTCVCNEGFADDHGKCEICDCGYESWACSFESGYRKCECKEGYVQKGEICQVGCTSYRPCHHGGFCKQWFCECLPGTTGEFCEFIDECDYLCPKRNGINCTYDVKKQEAFCKCSDEEQDFDPDRKECRRTCLYSEMCKNGGTCVHYTNKRSAFCDCLEGTSGDMCEEIPECGDKDCGYDAICAYNVDRKSAVCVCINEKYAFDEADKRCKRQCFGEGMCENGGYCKGEFCDCLEGTAGDMCEEIPECHKKDCGYDAICAYDVARKSAVCMCKEEKYAFDEVDNRCRRQCFGEGMCENGGYCKGEFCDCLEGTAGDMCEEIPECHKKDCGYDAICVYDVARKSAVCMCKEEKYAFDEVDNRCRRSCNSYDDCYNGGNCKIEGYFKFCNCLPGTKGDLCDVVEGCFENSTRCKGDAKCVFDVSKRKAVCECFGEGLQYDPLSEKCKMTCWEDAMCKNKALCMHRGDYLFCECKKGTSGELCETVDDCEIGLCGHSETVRCSYNAEKEAGICECMVTDHLFDPATKTCKACDCGKNAISCSFEDGKKICTCPKDFTVRNGTCQKTVCTEKKCFDGKCNVINGEEECSCFEGYKLEGDYCKKLNCSKTVCINGTCVVRYGNVEQCVCPAGFTLNKNICIRGLCRPDTCYGGMCEMVDDELTCVCPRKFHLQGIGCQETVCEVQNCFGGKCVVEDNKEICTCKEGYKLVNDVCKKILCEKKSCFGGICNLVDGKEECTCPDGYSIFEDVCRKN